MGEQTPKIEGWMEAVARDLKGFTGEPEGAKIIICFHYEPEAKRVQALEIQQQDLSLLVRQLCKKLGTTDLTTKALDYLKRKNLQGNPLREGHDGRTDAEV